MASNPIRFDDKNVVYPIAKLRRYTESVVENIIYLWTIENFSTRLSTFDSPKFKTPSNRNLQWYITIEQHPDYLSLYLTCTHKSSIIYRGIGNEAEFKFSLLNADGEKTNIRESKIAERFMMSSCEGFHKFISRRSLTNKAYGLLYDDTLRILCEIDVILDIKRIPAPSDIVEFKEPDCGFIESLGNLLKNGEFSDVTFVVGDEELPAYKGILASRSDVFAAMFRHQMEEQKLNRVTITDIEPDVFKEMLHFIYTDKAPNIDQMAGDLLFAADKYALDKLKAMCEKTLSVQLLIETAAGTLIIADLCNANLLKEQTINFINTYFSQVTKTEGWKILLTEHPAMVARNFQETEEYF